MIRFYDENNQEISSAAYSNNSLNATADITRNLRVSRVNVFFAHAGDWWLDKLHLGEPLVEAPAVATGTSVNAGDTYATVNGEVLDTGGGEISERGFYWNEVPELEGATQVTAGSGGGTFQAVLSELAAETEYHVWAYASNEVDTAIGERVTFQTTDGMGPVVLVPALELNHDNDAWFVADPSLHYVGAHDGLLPAESAIRFGLPALQGEIDKVLLRIYVSGQEGNAFAHLWGSYDDSWDASEAQSPSRDAELTNEIPVTETEAWLEFDVTGFVTDRLASGNDVSFVLVGDASEEGTHEFVFTGTGSNDEEYWPQLVIARTVASDNAALKSLTIAPSELNETFSPETLTYTATVPYEVESLTVTAEVDDEENATVTVSGEDDLSVGTNAVTVTVTAEDESTQSYTIEVTRLPLLPQVTTAVAGQIDDGSALAGGEVISGGEGNVSDAGIVWALSDEPELNDNMVSLSSATGEYSGTLTDLAPATRIHYRAYATNEAGTAYGDSLHFDTLTREMTLAGGFTPQKKTYDGTTSAVMAGTELNLSDVHSSHSVSLADVALAFDDASAGPEQTVRIVDAGLEGADADRYTLTLDGSPVETAEISPRPLTLSDFQADDKTYDGTTEATGVTFDDDRLAGDDLEFAFDAAFADPEIGDDKTVNVSNIAIDGGADQGNYTLVTTFGQTSAAIYPGTPESVVLVRQPEPVVAGATVPAPEVRLFDAQDVPVRDGFAVTATLNGGEFTASSTTTAHTNEDGVAVFDNLVIEQAGEGYTITFTIDDVD